jgi:hypothetical protein
VAMTLEDPIHYCLPSPIIAAELSGRRCRRRLLSRPSDGRLRAPQPGGDVRRRSERCRHEGTALKGHAGIMARDYLRRNRQPVGFALFFSRRNA